ncbi:MAG: LPS-assembly protein LptD [Treponema sp.]|jgi:hypothetical protein|nr:LPS-assembly protein LptD [Treponema sp.]
MKNKRIFLLCCFLSLSTLLYAQESTVETEEQIEVQTEDQLAEGTDDETEQTAVEASPLTRRLEMEIRTSTLSELAAWSRSLGLSEGGTRAELATRIRNHLELPTPQGQDEASRKTITIESAQSSEYFTIDVIDEDYARLRGDVRIKLKDGEAVHTITAGEILFNRTRNILTARGGVVYEKVEADKTETFRGENITVNIDNWSSTFLDGSTIHSSSGEIAYLFSGAVISHSDEDVTILSNAQVSNANSDEPYWSISASRIWLLPGSDFAILNAVLKVGEIPVLYIPFLYYPTDEMIFHPVIGYRSREGGFIQTTTYILGQPKADEGQSSSINAIFGNTGDAEKERQGIFLRSTGKKKIAQDEVSLRALFDYYVNLGTYLGIELYVPRKNIFNPLNLTLGIGFTRTISPNTDYNPFAPNYDGTFEQNHSNFLSIPVPFRYQMAFNSRLSGAYGSFGWDFSYYSDPRMTNDFDPNKRSETMDYMNMIQQGSLFDDDGLSDDGSPATPKWNISGSLTPPVKNLPSYVPGISINNISTTLTFKSLTDASVNAYAPERLFFVPDKLIIYSLSGTIWGTPFSTGGTQSQTNTGATTEQTPKDPLADIGSPVPPWTTDDSTQTITVPDIITPPALSQTFNLPGTGNTKVSIDYRLLPTSSSELQFMSRNWKTYSDVDWGEAESILTAFGGNGNLNLRIDHSTGLFSNTITLSGSGAWHEYTYLNEEVYADPITGNIDEDKMEEKRRSQYSQTNYATSYAYNGTLRPLYADPIFAQTSLQYNLISTLVRSRRYSDGNIPELTPIWGSWVKERTNENIYGLTSHYLSANLVAKIMDKNQEIKVTANLPPLDGSITTNAIFRAWISTTDIRFAIEKPENSDTWKFKQPGLQFIETLTFGPKASFLYNMVINPEENNEITSIRATLALWGFTTEFTAIRDIPSVFVPDNPSNPSLGGAWDQQGEKDLIPSLLKFSYNRQLPSTKIFNNRVNLNYNLNTSLNFNLQQPTDSKFELTLSLIMDVTKFCTITLSANSTNSVIWRYFKGVPGMEDLTSMYADGEQNNLFIDLIDSFNFFDETRRRRTGFKMQNFDLKIEHLLGDWTANLSITMYPYRNQHTPIQRVEITSDISFTLRWTPIKEIKSEINYRGETNRWQIQ